MKFSENWLREFVAINADRDELCRRLTMAGLEVESVTALGEGLDGVVVAEIVACEPHPNADKLRVCQVQAGTGTPLQIVCGAPNARVGLKAPLATIGAVLPGGLQIKQAALRGVESNGMLCSAKELLVDADASGLMELPTAAPVGTPLAKYLSLPDSSIELKITPNRPDCLGLRGLAYDAAALFGTLAIEPKIDAVPARNKTQREVTLDAGADCPRYLGRMIEGIDATTKSPLWMAERLRRSGLRPISAVVDVANYVMLELGQPMHAFDNDLLGKNLCVRHAHEGEKLKLLDGNTIMLDENCVINADEHQPLGLAGVMGGYESRVTDTTKNIFLESAHFAPSAIMGRARKFGLHTDASHRFERGVDPELPRQAIERATVLLLDIVGGVPGPVTEAVRTDQLPKREHVHLRRTRLARVLGMHVADDEVERIFRALGMQVEATRDGWQVTPPSRRFDIEIEEDLIEEVVRVHGYERVPTRSPSGELRLQLAPEAQVPESRVRQQMAARGYREAITYSFVANELLQRWALDTGVVALANPLSADLAVMRTSLLPGIVQALQRNANRQQDRVRLFELGRVFARGDEAPIQTLRVAGTACGRAAPETWVGDKRLLDFHDIKADLETLLGLRGGSDVAFDSASLPAFLHPGRSARVVIHGVAVGFIGGLHPRLLKTLDLDFDVYVFEVDLTAVTAGFVPRAGELSRFPSVRRDLAMVVPEAVEYASIASCVRTAVGPTLAELVVFDRYTGTNLGSGIKSLAIGLILQDSYRTLTDADADRCMATAITALERDCQAKLRG